MGDVEILQRRAVHRLCSKPFWDWMQHALRVRFSSNLQRWVSGSRARNERFAMLASRSSCRNPVNCRRCRRSQWCCDRLGAARNHSRRGSQELSALLGAGRALLRRTQRLEEALAAYERAIGLCEDSAMREFLTEKAAEVR
jgi:hypothetical protein